MPALRTLLFVFAASLAACTSSTSTDYANGLSGCLDGDHIDMLNNACAAFDAQLAKTYPDQPLGEAYQSFLSDVQAMELGPAFFVTPESRSILSAMREEGTFDLVWAKWSMELGEEIIVSSGSTQAAPPEMEYYALNAEGDYIACVEEANTNEDMAEYLAVCKQNLGLSPGLLAAGVQEALAPAEFDVGLNRLIIAIGFYYEFALVLEGG